MLATVDVTIRGAGIFGLSIAWAALSRGARVRVVDPNGVGSGSSGGVVGALQPHTPDQWNKKKAFQRDSLVIASDFWSEVEATAGRSSGFTRVGRLMPLVDARALELAHKRAQHATENWPEWATWTVTDAVDTGWSAPSPTGFYVHDTLSAILHPRLACDCLAAAILARGGEVVAEAPDQGPVIHATGWDGLRDLSERLGRDVGNGVKGQAATLAYDAAGQPQIYADGLHVIPHLNGTVGLGSTSEPEFDSATSTDGSLDALIAKGRDLIPALANAEVVDRWAGVRPRARSRAPLLGQWPDRRDHYVANGGFKIGFGMAPKVAEVMTNLVLEGIDDIPEEFSFDAL